MFRSSTTVGAVAVLASLVAQNLGAACAKLLFPSVGAYGVTALRIAFAALLLLGLRRPWKRAVARDDALYVIAYGAALGLMNVLIYQAFARIPLGIAVGIEIVGPLAVALLGSRHVRDLAWFALAVSGLALLLPLRADEALDPVGVAFALGAATCWALYIVFGKRVSRAVGGDGVAWGMLVAASFAVPLGVATAGGSALAPRVLAIGFAVAVLSSALPYLLEMEALRRVPAHVFGILVSAAPAVSALAGFIVLDEHLTLHQGLAIALIMSASTACAIDASVRA